MKVLRFRENTAILISCIDSLEWYPAMKDCKARITICTRQLIMNDFFDTDEEAKRNFNKIVREMESCND